MTNPKVRLPVDTKLTGWQNLTSEQFREYTFAGGAKVRIENPVALHVKRGEKGDSHRILDAQDQCHYIHVGWLSITWQVRGGANHFDF